MAFLNNTTSDYIQYVGDGTNRPGDIGAQLNAAYAALPASGGKIIITPKRGGGAYNFSTPVVMTTIGKYPFIEATAPGGANSTEGCCLNFIPTSGSAFTFDYSTVVIGPPAGSSGLRDITLVNNSCWTSGGCGSSATGIMVGVTNGGDWDAFYDCVTIQGFGVGYNNQNNTAVTQQWNNAVFLNNTVCLTSAGTTMRFVGGQFAANGKIFLQPAGTHQGELYFVGTNTFDNFSDPVFDYTVSSTIASLSLTDTHIENSPSLHTHYVEGYVNLAMTGGLLEDDSSTGTSDWMIKTYNFTLVSIIGTTVVSNRPLTCIVDMTNEVRATIVATILSPTNIPNLAAGAFVSEATVMPLNRYGTSPIPWSIRSPLYLGDVPKFGGTNATAAGSAALGANCPAVTATAPYTWVRILTADGSTAFIPAWK
jgi:hypothetical protein